MKNEHVRAATRSAQLLIAITVSLFLALAVGQAIAGDEAHWSYEGENGPEHWADLSPEFVLCRHGVNQSPLDIRETIEAELRPLTIHYQGRTKSVTNNGHTLQVDVGEGNVMRVEGQEFRLVQFHVHSPSEHWIRGEAFPLEAHFVHQNAAGELAVVGVLFRLGDDHADLLKIGEQAPRKKGQTKPLDLDLARMTITREHDSYLRYTGSLTTPPCSEGVRWYVLKEVSHISKKQVKNFIELIGEDARGPEPQNARIVLEH